MLTLTQLQALKTEITNDAALNAYPQNSDGAFAIADILNLTAAPDFWVWRTFVAKEEYVSGASVDGTNFSWTGTGFITRSVGERDAWRELFQNGSCNPSLPNVRQAFTDIFSGGVAPAPANRTHLSAVSRRKATRAEQVLATGTGSTGSPGLLTFEGELTYQDVQDARAS
jgi:hypothetical protein